MNELIPSNKEAPGTLLVTSEASLRYENRIGFLEEQQIDFKTSPPATP